LGVWVNRIFSFVLGGVLVLGFMSLGVAAPLRTENAALAARLDEVENGAARLLGEAKAYLASESYTNAERSLAALIERQAASTEAVEGKVLYADLLAAVALRDQRWAAAMPTVRLAWEKTTAAQFRADADAARARVEATIPENLSTQWEQARDRVRLEWEKGEI
jgi:hypothetical protein